jgi:hypothetical protein
MKKYEKPNVIEQSRNVAQSKKDRVTVLEPKMISVQKNNMKDEGNKVRNIKPT